VVLTISKPQLEDKSEKLKISDKDSHANIAFADVMDKGSNALLPTKLDNMKATQNLVEKKLLAPIILVSKDQQGNPLRNKIKKKKRVHQELAKFDEEILNRIPAEKLAALIENHAEEGDHDALASSLRSEIKNLIADVMLEKGESQKEIASTTSQMHTAAQLPYVQQVSNMQSTPASAAP
jgi:hypothetical protein